MGNNLDINDLGLVKKMLCNSQTMGNNEAHENDIYAEVFKTLIIYLSDNGKLTDQNTKLPAQYNLNCTQNIICFFKKRTHPLKFQECF